MEGPDLNSTDGISGHMVDSIGDDDIRQPPAPPAREVVMTDTAPPPVTHECDCKKQVGVMRAALVVLAVIIGLLAMLFLVQRRGHGHGSSEEDNSTPAN